MASKFKVMSDEDYIALGRQEGSDAVALEAEQVKARWQRDLADLTSFGFGPVAYDKFALLAQQHQALRAQRPVAVAAQATALNLRNVRIEDGQLFVEQTVSALALPAAEDEQLANELNAAVPADVASIDAAILTLADILERYQDKVEPAFNAAAMVAKAPALATALKQLLAGAEQAKHVPVQETRDIDLLDGKILHVVRTLNKTGRQLYRKLHNDAKVHEYRYQYDSHFV